ncbi:hypothetical protein DFH09DRAFT_933729 [Mycena vulgaris]|nr:hypothetical protein DFH09DRAFT_933729 [Mycena vulgaris]
MTAHKAQGKTMEAIIVDLETSGCWGSESPYVMLSRAKSLDGIFILRPFRLETIQCRPSQDVRNEFKRLDMLCHQTTMKYGSSAEAAEAQQYLVKNFSTAALPNEEDSSLSSTFAAPEARRLAALQATTARLISGQEAPPSGSSRTPRRARNTKRVPAQELEPMVIDSEVLAESLIQRKRPHLDEDSPGRTRNTKRRKQI